MKVIRPPSSSSCCKRSNRLCSKSSAPTRLSKLAISMHVFPEDWDPENSNWIGDSKLYPELQPRLAKKHLHLGVKRAIDVAASAALLIVTLPFVALIALIIKLTSKGPVLFEQERLGQFGARFKCLKFRTMHTNCDAKIHREYVQQFIAGNAQQAQDATSEKTLYKLTADPRVTAIGRILRKTSLDEFPQFWNVLRGDMSLVGPRPPVPYEFEVYDIWHRRRVLELKPGITGLWQVSGRNRTRFDEMVRLDLRYSQEWSLWLDLKIIFATPSGPHQRRLCLALLLPQPQRCSPRRGTCGPSWRICIKSITTLFARNLTPKSAPRIVGAAR